MKKLARVQGFTLIELMVVIAIVGIITAFAIVNYSNSVQKARRSDARDAITYAASLQERWYLQFTTYSNDIDDIGGAASNEGYYTISVDNTVMGASACQGGDGTCYTITATATGAQADDTRCATFSLDNLGRKTATNDECW